MKTLTENCNSEVFFTKKNLPKKSVLIPEYFFEFTSFLVFLFTFISIKSQTCNVGSATSSTGYGVTVTGATAHSQNAAGSILPAGTSLSCNNSATLSQGASMIIDMQRNVSGGSSVTVSYARLNSSGAATASLEYSVNGTTWINSGTSLSASSGNAVYSSFTAPSGGLRYLRITQTSSNNGLYIDGVQSTHYCYKPVSASLAIRAFYVPGNNKGSLSSNIFPSNAQTLKYSVIKSPANGTFSLDANSGVYSYDPGSGFDGLETIVYKVCDGGPDGDFTTSSDNNCDEDTLIMRAIFNCDTSLFYIPIPENEAMDYLKDISGFSGGNVNNDPQDVYIGLSVMSDAIVIYDHWEDGYENNPRNPVQSTTQIWGDGDLSNGIAPGFADDILSAGKTSILMNPLNSGHNNNNNYDPNLSANDATLKNIIDYDGRDKILIHGIGAMSKFSWGTQATLSMSGSAVPRTEYWGTRYTLPAGMNTPNSGVQFEITSFSIIAQKNGTTVSIDHDANGTADINITLNEGETFYLDSRTGSTLTVNQGATIVSSYPVQVMLMTGPYNNNTKFQGRTFALTPNSQLSNCYYMPGIPNETVRVFLYNPSTSAINVTRTTSGGTTSTLTIPAQGSAYDNVNNSGEGYEYCSNSSSFAILSTVDYNNSTSDWGFVPVPKNNLQQIVIMSVGVGSDPTSQVYGNNNYDQLMVTPVSATYFYADLNGDGTPDKFSINDDIDATDNAVSIGSATYNETNSDNGVYVDAYKTLTLGGTNGSLNGAVIWTKTASGNKGNSGAMFAAVWGQNGGPAGSPNVDAGYTIPPKLSPPLNYNVKVKYQEICPGNTSDSIFIGVDGGTAPYRINWVNLSTGEGQTYSFSTPETSIPGITSGNYIIKIKDAGCMNYTKTFTVNQKLTGCFVNLSGNVFNDGNALEDSIVNNFGSGALPGEKLYCNLVNHLGKVEASCIINNGTYRFNSVHINSAYTLQLTTSQGSKDSLPPSVKLPSNWIYTGENIGINKGNDKIPNGFLSVNIKEKDVDNANFGIEKRPESEDKTLASMLNPGGNIKINVPSLKGSDNEDGNLGTGNTIVIKSLPSNAKLYYNSTEISSNQVIKNYNPALLKTDPLFEGPGKISFLYVFKDLALMEDLSPAEVIIPLTGIYIKGNIYHDGNGLTDQKINGKKTGVFGSVKLKTYLIDSAYTVQKIVNAGDSGVYLFDSLSGNSTYRILISCKTLNIGSKAPDSATLPKGFIITGEQYGNNNQAGNGIINSKYNGFIKVKTGTENISLVDYGIQSPGLAHDKSYAIDPDQLTLGTKLKRFACQTTLNNASGTGDTTIYTGLPGKLSGYDLEDGRYGGSLGSNLAKTLVLINLPDTSNGLLVYNDIQLWPYPAVSTPAYTYWDSAIKGYKIPDFNHNSLKLYLKLNQQLSTQFRYTYQDSGNIIGAIAVYRLSYATPLSDASVKLNARLIKNTTSLLEWKPKNPVDIKYWELYRRHESSSEFTKIYRIEETGKTAYTYNDNLEDQPRGKFYYELKGYSSSDNLSRIYGKTYVNVNFNNEYSVNLVPNPSKGQTRLVFEGTLTNETYDVILLDPTGKIVKQLTGNGSELIINTQGLNTGIYSLTIYREQKIINLKLLIE